MLDDGTTIEPIVAAHETTDFARPITTPCSYAAREVRAARDRNTSAPTALTSASAAAIRARCSPASSPGRAAIAPASPAGLGDAIPLGHGPEHELRGVVGEQLAEQALHVAVRTDLDGVVGISAVRHDDREAHVELRGEHREEREHRSGQPALGAVVESIVVGDRDEARQDVEAVAHGRATGPRCRGASRR